MAHETADTPGPGRPAADDPTPPAGFPVPGGDPTTQGGTTTAAQTRWRGSAVVPPPSPRRRPWDRLLGARGAPPSPPDRPPPPVDPWAGQDDGWWPDTGPTRDFLADLSPTTAEPPLPPTRIGPPLGPPPSPPQGPAQGPPPGPPPGPPAPTGPAAPHGPAAPGGPAAPIGPAAPPNRRARRAARRALAQARQSQARDAQARQAQARRLDAARPATPPVARPPAPPPRRPGPPPRRPGPPPPPRRRRRRWLRRLMTFFLLGMVCCCGVPALYSWPVLQHFPATAVLPHSMADLTLLDDEASTGAAATLADDVRARHGFFTDAFAALYRDDAGRRVVVYGATGLRLTPRDDLTQETARYPDRYGVESLAAVDTGAPGVHVSCGAGRVDGTRVTVCGWADHGSVATVVFHRRSADDAAQLVNRIRTAVLSRGDWTDVSVSGR